MLRHLALYSLPCGGKGNDKQPYFTSTTQYHPPMRERGVFRADFKQGFGQGELVYECVYINGRFGRESGGSG